MSAFGIGSRLVDGNVCGCGANRIFDVEGRSFCCSLSIRCVFGLFVGWLVESLRTPVTMLRLFIGAVLELVAVCVLTGVDVLVTEMFSWSESESCMFELTERFLHAGAINLSISF